MELELAMLALQMFEKVYPVLQAEFQKGTLTPEQQLKVRTMFENYKNLANKFSGPEWNVNES